MVKFSRGDIIRFIIILIMFYIIGLLIGSAISSIINPQPQVYTWQDVIARG